MAPAHSCSILSNWVYCTKNKTNKKRKNIFSLFNDAWDLFRSKFFPLKFHPTTIKFYSLVSSGLNQNTSSKTCSEGSHGGEVLWFAWSPQGRLYPRGSRQSAAFQQHPLIQHLGDIIMAPKSDFREVCNLTSNIMLLVLDATYQINEVLFYS